MPAETQASMFLYEMIFALVDQYEMPEALPTDNDQVLELKAALAEVWCLGHIIIDNMEVKNNGSLDEYERVEIQVQSAFILLEKIGSLHIPEDDDGNN